MKRIIPVLALAAFCSGIAGARTLSPSEALNRATGEQMHLLGTDASQLRLIKTARVDDVPVYYLFEQGAKVTAVSASDLTMPLLAVFESRGVLPADYPPQTQWWLGEYSRQIAAAEASAATLTVNVAEGKRYAELQAAREDVGPLMKTTWNQSAPYNNLCPILGSERCVTGCVATAMAQAMGYWKYPDTGTGSISYTWSAGSQTLSMDFSSVTFDWDNILDAYPTSTSGTEAQRTAIATLMKACGYSVQMSYNVASAGGSGAASIYVPVALTQYFNYDCGVNYLTRNYYTLADWEEMMYANLKNVGPICYSGSTSSDEGHEFICDGYRTSDGLFHINWGWEGICDGWYRLDALNPDTQGIGGAASGEGFDYEQAATIGIQPPTGSSTAPDPFMGVEGTFSGSISGNTVTLTGINGGFYNRSYLTGDFTIGILFTNADETVKAYGIYGSAELESSYGFPSISADVPSAIGTGTWRAIPAYKVDGGEWAPMLNNINSSTQYYEFYIDRSTTGSVTVLDYEVSEFVLNKTGVLTLTFDNSYSTAQTLSTSVYLATYNESTNSFSPKLQFSPASVNLPASSSIDKEFTVEIPSTFTPGDYYILVLSNGSWLWEPIPVTVLATSGIGDMGADSLLEAPGRIYDLQGRPVDAEHAGKGIYIRRTADGRSAKVLIN